MARGNLHVAGVCIRSICLDKHLFWGQVSPRRAPVPFTRPLTGRRDHWQANDPAFTLFFVTIFSTWDPHARLHGTRRGVS